MRKLAKKIRESELGKIPFMLIVGEQEAESNQVAVRKRGHGDIGAMSIEEFAKIINDEIEKELALND
jgi:threonyl-tRNA synthetase